MTHRPKPHRPLPTARAWVVRVCACACLALSAAVWAAPDPAPDPAQAPAEIARLQQENQALAARLAAAEAELAALRAGAAQAADRAPPSPPDPHDWPAQIAVQIEAELEAEYRAREAALLARQAEREAEFDARLGALRARLPAPEGGSVTVAEARSRATADAAALTRLLDQARGIDNPDLWGEVRTAENALHQSQFLLARADNARTVYRTRPGDSLALVSGLFYGDPGQWSRLYDANRHVLDDPNRIPPGVTLVVP